MRDALDRIDKQNPGLILKFGGHAMAAGLSIAEKTLSAFLHWQIKWSNKIWMRQH